MPNIYKMSDGEIKTINMNDYAEDEFLCASLDFLGTNPNSHKINISEEVFRECAPSVLGKFLVAEVQYGDATTHTENEFIQGYVPREQEVRFVRNKDGYLRGIVDVVVSKQYASDFCEIFRKTNHQRAVSVEMMVQEDEAENGGTVAKNFNIVGVTVLGMMTKPSSPGSNIDVTRFAENNIKEECENYYKSIWEKFEDKQSTYLDAFVKNKKAKMEKSYSINEDKLKETPWGDVDKIELRNAVVNAKNSNSIVNKVYLIVEKGWQDAPSEKLKYPVMELDGSTFYYNRFALASALAYAKQHDEADVISKINKIYKKFDLAEEGEEENMSKKNFEIEGREAWADIIEDVQEHEGKDAYVDSVEDDHIIFTVDDVRYRVEAEIKVGEDDDKVEADIDWETKKEDADQDMSEEEPADETAEGEEDMGCGKGDAELEDPEASDDKDDKEDSEEEVPEEDMSKDEKIKELEDIIMAKDAEIAELKAYKEEKENEERDFTVQQTLAEIRECVDSETFEALKAEGMACKLEDIDGWKNKAKSLAFDASAQKKDEKLNKWSMSIPTQNSKKSANKWDSI